MRVLVSSDNIVDLRPGPDVRFQAADTGGGVTAAIGKGLVQIGQAVGERAVAQSQINEQLDDAAAKQADTQVASKVNDLLYTGDDAYFSKRGQDALNARAGTQQAIRDAISEVRIGLKSPLQQHLFDSVVSRRQQEWLTGIGRHSTEQAYDYHKTASVARQALATQDYVRNADDPEQLAVQRATIVGEVRAQSKLDGMEGAPAQYAETKAVSDANAAVVRSKSGIDPDAAKLWFDSHRGEIEPTTAAALDRELEPYMSDQQADTIANQLRGSGPTGSVAKAFAPTSSSVGSKLIALESGGDPTAHNSMPRQTASGLGQFTDGSWLSLYKKTYGAGGKTDDQILALKTDPVVGRRMVDAGVDDVRVSLGRLHAPTDDGAVRLAWFLGPDKAATVLKAPPSTPVASLVPNSYVANNVRALSGKTAGQVVDQAYREMGGHGPVAAPVNGPRRDDLNGQLAAVDALELPFKQSQAVKQRLMQLSAIDSRLKEADEKQAADQAWTTALDPHNTTVRSIPPSIWSKVPPQEQRSIMAALDHNAIGRDPAPNPDLYLDLSERAAKGSLTFSDVRSAWGKMPKGDWEQMATLARSIEKQGGEGKTVKVTLDAVKGVVSNAVNAQPGLSYTGIGNKSSDAPARQKVAQRRYAFEKAIMDDIAVWQSQPEHKGKAPDTRAIQAMADRQLLQWNRGEQVSGWFGSNPAPPVYRFEASPGTRGRIAIPPADMNRLRSTAQRILGRDPTEAELTQAYLLEARGGR